MIGDLAALRHMPATSALAELVFIDTNIILYAALGRQDTPEKWAIARDLMSKSDFAVSSQVLAEFYHNAVRKGRVPLIEAEALAWVTTLAKRPCQAIDSDLVQGGIAVSTRYKISYWDGSIVAAARRLSAKTVYSEDLNHGQKYEEIRVINPFLIT